MINVPRISLPEAVGKVLMENDLKSPNDLTDTEYNNYSAAAIGGTLLFFVPGAALFFDVSGFFENFIFSALVGGGAGAYLALRKDQAGEYANKLGESIMTAVGNKNIPRISLPGAVGDVLEQNDLNSPNNLSDTDYNNYSAAAIGGTLLFLLPGALVFDISPVFADFAFSALIGGGAGAYLALRKDQAGEYANKLGGAIMQVADKVLV